MIRSMLVLTLVFAGCERPTETPETTQKAKAVSVEKTDAQPEKGAAEARAAQVKRVKFEPADFESHLPDGRILSSFAFEDSNGLNAVFYSLTESSTKPSDPYAPTQTTAVLKVIHLVQKNTEFEVVRTYREVVEDCEFDLIMQPHGGDWAVSDVDGDGIGEATIAYTADCTSDVSPLNHKVLITEGGEKYGLRGSTRVIPGPGPRSMGGEFKADAMDPRFLEHATSVWNKTIIPYEN